MSGVVAAGRRDGPLERLRAADEIGVLDYWLACTLGELTGGGAGDDVLLAAALASRDAAAGHVCLDLAAAAGIELAEGSVACPQLAPWLAALAASPLVCAPGEHAPLVLDAAAARLYLHRYWRYEAELAAWIRERAAVPDESLDRAAVRQAIERVYGSRTAAVPDGTAGPSGSAVPAVAGVDWQKLAAVAALRRRFCVITGGPGTGKTTVAGRILDVLAAAAGGVSAVLAAPTGKAADRLAEAIGERPGVRCQGGTTMHRLLYELRIGRLGAPDVVVLDEASMADIALLAALVRVLPQRTRLLVLGDRDQLASVEAGAVLGDVCAGPVGARLDDLTYSQGFRRDAKDLAGIELPAPDAAAAGAVPALRDAVVSLQHSWRFSPTGGIGALSRAVNAGDGDRALGVLEKRGEAWLLEDPAGLGVRIVAGFTPCLRARDAAAALAMLKGFCVLAALRHGPTGALELNRWIEGLLAAAGLVRPGRRWYAGLPIIVTRNDHVQRLYNGDVGVVRAGDDGILRACFGAVAGAVRTVPLSRLPDHEPAYALTVHKSQGSEFDQVALVLPPEPVRVLTRELLYTAITRARSRVEVWGREAVLRAAIATVTERRSGLRDALWRA
jgi:exodeoxyribonuclease V alpha subunit